MLRTRTMAALAVDTIRQLRRKQILTTVAISAFGKLQSGVVAKQAAVIDLAREIVMLFPVVSRADGPTFFLRIPRHRQLRQDSSRRKVQITARMISGANDVVDFLLEQIQFPALVKLVALLEEPAVTAQHAVVTLGGSVKKPIVLFVVLNDVACSRAIERPRHGDVLIAVIDFHVAGPAGNGVDVVGYFERLRRRRRGWSAPHAKRKYIAAATGVPRNFRAK